MQNQAPQQIAVIPGDGIGKEVTTEALKVLAAVAPDQFETTEYSLGADHYLATGDVLTDEVLAQLKTYDAILLGAVGGKPGDPNLPPGILERGLLLRLRFELDHYVNLRPSRIFPGVASPLADPGEVDFVVVREGTEGPYTGNGGALRVGTPAEVATEVSVNTAYGVERVVRDAFARALVGLDHEPAGPEEDAGPGVGRHHAPGAATVGHGHKPHHARQQRRQPQRHDDRPPPPVRDVAPRRQPVDELGHGEDEPHRRRPDREDQAHGEELAHDAQGDAEEEEHAVRQRQHAVDVQDRALPGVARGRADALGLVESLERVVLERLGGPLHEVGDLEQVAEHVVPVEFHQRVGVEDHGRDAAGEHDVERELVEDLPVVGVFEDQGRPRGHREFEEHPPRANERAFPLVGQGPRRRRVDVGRRHEHEDHGPELGHLPPQPLADEPVPALVDDLDGDERDE